MSDWIAALLNDPELLRMGHDQRAEDRNLGLGWLYYATARVLRPRCGVVIGSYRGFVPLVLGKAMQDNLEGGVLHFIDPSLVDDFWNSPSRVQAHFLKFGVANISHHLATTEDFAHSASFADLCDVGLLFIDGYHTLEQARFDFLTFAPKLRPDAMVFFHDTATCRISRIYGPGREYRHSVKELMSELRQEGRFDLLEFAQGSGVTLVRLRPGGSSWLPSPTEIIPLAERSQP
jgi:hypothetical protein